MDVKRILIVEDHPSNQVLLKAILGNCGYHLEIVDNGQEAIDILNIDPNFQLIILDMMMPVMDGLQFLESSEEIIRENQIQICMLSALTDQEKISKALKLGANDYLTKPIEQKKLIAKISNLMER